MPDRTFVIVGASLTGARAAETLREEGFDGSIVLVGAEPDRPYERPPLSKDLLTGAAERDSAFVHDAGWYAEHDVTLRLATTATALDIGSHQVELAGGERLAYSKLLLATGSTVKPLTVPGADRDGVRYLRTLPESDALSAAITPSTRVVVIGAGWIGLEVAAAARGRGATVTVLESDDQPLNGVVGPEVGRVFNDLHRAHGTDVRVGVTVTELAGDCEQAAVSEVVLGDGTRIPADLVVAGIGVQPDDSLAAAAGLAVDGGVLVDAALRTSDPDVYAAGDVASLDHPWLPGRVLVGHWDNAENGGRAVARSMLGQEVSYDTVPYFYTDQFELSMEYAGWAPDGWDRVVFRGDPATYEFVSFWLQDGRVVAGMNSNVWVNDDIKALVREGYAGKRVDPARLTDPEVDLADLHD